jgi:tRNA modification GTPase
VSWGADTIAAIATAPGRGGIGIVRVSGPLSSRVARGILGAVPAPRRAEYRRFRSADGQEIDEGIALFMPQPGSYTGEDVLELQGHGGPVVLDRLLARALDLGARAARPGEFTERAYLNDRLDLAQAEAVADLIDAGTEMAARAAVRSLDGALSRAVDALCEALAELRTWVEAAIDFPEEEIDFLADRHLAARIEETRAALDDLLQRAHQGVLLRDGLTLVITGRPNVGKSSLLNALAEREAAIVTDVPGTTRDPVEARIVLHGMPVGVVDTAGLRDAVDAVERIGIERAWSAIARADVLVVVCEDDDGPGEWERRVIDTAPPSLPKLIVRNKIDRTDNVAETTEEVGLVAIRLSAKSAAGVDLLREALARLVGQSPAGEGEFTARRRHLDALARARASLDQARARLAEGAGEMAAEDLRVAHQALGEITGSFTTEDLLERIFSSFCIGK